MNERMNEWKINGWMKHQWMNAWIFTYEFHFFWTKKFTNSQRNDPQTARAQGLWGSSAHPAPRLGLGVEDAVNLGTKISSAQPPQAWTWADGTWWHPEKRLLCHHEIPWNMVKTPGLTIKSGLNGLLMDVNGIYINKWEHESPKIGKLNNQFRNFTQNLLIKKAMLNSQELSIHQQNVDFIKDEI